MRVASISTRVAVVAVTSVMLGMCLLRCTSFSSDDPVAGAGSSEASAEAAAADAADASIGDGAVLAPYPAAVMHDPPVAYWRMGVRTGLFVPDETGHGHDLFMQGESDGGWTFGVEGAIVGESDTAIRFDGRTGYARTAPASFRFLDRAPFTLEAWAKREAIADGDYFQYLISSMEGVSGNRSGYSLFVLPQDSGLASSAFEYDRYAEGDLGVVGSQVTVGQWGHYVAVFDGMTMTLYVNGTKGGSKDVTGTGGVTMTGADLVIGALRGGAYHHAGIIDEVAIYDKALTLPQIAAHRLASGRP